ncbi:hypothetical protein ACMGE5_06475 [Macrococcus equi]|uniref:hypothetical protein n=1 Tax=Macrococcus equi TaxID=3395462 RepID=UPI0039BE6599
MDERNEKIITKSMALVLSIIYLIIIIIALTNYIKSGEIESITSEIIFLISIPTLIAVFSHRNESLFLPRKINGDLASTNFDTTSKRERLKLYSIGSGGFALFCLILDILDSIFIQKEWNYFSYIDSNNETVNIIVSITIDFLITLIVFFILSLIMDEIMIKRYNKKLDKLEEE